MRISDWSSDVCSSDLVEMADRKLVAIVRPARFGDQSALVAVDIGERGLHGRKIELGAREIRMGADAAVADGKRMAVRQHQELVRPDAMGRQLADAGIAGRAIVDADDTTTGLVVVFGRVEQARSEEHTSEIQSLMRT